MNIFIFMTNINVLLMQMLQYQQCTFFSLNSQMLQIGEVIHPAISQYTLTISKVDVVNKPVFLHWLINISLFQIILMNSRGRVAAAFHTRMSWALSPGAHDVAVMSTTRHNASAAILNRKRRLSARDGRQPRRTRSQPPRAVAPSHAPSLWNVETRQVATENVTTKDKPGRQSAQIETLYSDIRRGLSVTSLCKYSGG